MARSIASSSVCSSTSSSCWRAQPRATSTASSSASARGGSPRRDGRSAACAAAAARTPGVDLADDDRLARLDVGSMASSSPVGSTGAGPPTAPPRSSGRSRRCGAAPAARRSPARARRASRCTSGRHSPPTRRAEREPVSPSSAAPRGSACSCRLPARRRAAPSAGGRRRARRDRLHRGGAAAYEDRRRVVGDLHDPAEIAEEADVDGCGPATARAPGRARRGSRRRLPRSARGRAAAGWGRGVESSGLQGLAGRPRASRNRRPRLASGLPLQSSSAAAKTARMTTALLLRERPQQELALAPVARARTASSTRPATRSARRAPPRSRRTRRRGGTSAIHGPRLLERHRRRSAPGRRGAPRAG